MSTTGPTPTAITVTSPWIGSGTESDPYRPKFTQDYPQCATWQEQDYVKPPTNGTHVIWTDATTAAQIQANPTYAQAKVA